MATQNVDLDTTISALRRGLTSIPVDQAIAVINSWQQQLSGTDLAEDLDELKLAITSNNGDRSALADILIDLGEDTSDAATNLSGDVAAKVKQLAKLLTEAGESLR